MPKHDENSGSSMDLIWGAAEIAKLIGRSPRATFHMLDNGELPAKKVGGRWVAERGNLLRFFMGDAA
ncbi:DNA-binding protein [Sinorhizobium fredii]|uniref:DNA-binding protein n=1 Tax=Rhizobium fredii TaxID=380 RepID=UPI0004AD172B|nr:DNA-binding protein [Sinorhizobium fredii]